MGTILVTTNLSLDCIVEDPDGQEGTQRGGWFGRFGGADLDVWTKILTAEALEADALLLGRRTDDWFASRWTTRTGEWADRLNTMPKYVGSTTAGRVQRGNGTLLAGDVATEVAKLKQDVDGEILVYASTSSSTSC